MSDTLGDKFNFNYLEEMMVTDGIFTDNTKTKVVEDIIDKVKTWYIKQIHDKSDWEWCCFISYSRMDSSYGESWHANKNNP